VGVKINIGTRVFENRLLRRILGLTREKVIAGWRKLRNELGESCNMYRSTEKCVQSFGRKT
jgi:hypothetical protein